MTDHEIVATIDSPAIYEVIRLRENRFIERACLDRPEGAFPVTWTLPRLPCIDHFRALLDHELGAIFIVISPYGNPARHEAELKANGIPFCQIPREWSPYGGGTTSFLLTYQHTAKLLSVVMSRLS